MWRVPETPLPADLALLHTGSIGAAVDPGRHDGAGAAALGAGAATTSYDPNVRPRVLRLPAAALARVEEFVAAADVVKAPTRTWSGCCRSGRRGGRAPVAGLRPGPRRRDARRRGAVAVSGAGTLHVPAPASTWSTRGRGRRLHVGLLHALAEHDLRAARRCPGCATSGSERWSPSSAQPWPRRPSRARGPAPTRRPGPSCQRARSCATLSGVSPSAAPPSVPRFRRLARLAWLGVLVAGVVAYVVVLRVMVRTENLNFFPSLLLIGAITVPVSVLAFAGGGRPGSGRPRLARGLGRHRRRHRRHGDGGTLEFDTLRTLGAIPCCSWGSSRSSRSCSCRS